MIPIQPNLFLLEGLRVSNVYLLTSPEGLTLVDGGPAGQADKILAELEKAGHPASDLRQVVITHAHDDHTGSVAEIVRRTGARVLAYKDEVPYIARTAHLPYKSLLSRSILWLEGRVIPAPPSIKVNIALEDGQVIPGTGGYTALHAPGHTPGSMCLYHPERHILIAGDALFNKNPMTGKPGLIMPLGMISTDMSQARQSVARLAGLEVDVLLCGHGEPILKDASIQIKKI